MTAPQAYRGERIGLPADGPGSLATTWSRFAAFLVDAVACSLLAALVVPRHDAHSFADRLPGSWSLIPLAVDYVGGVLIAGRTLGMYLLGLRMIRVQQPIAVDPARIVLRTVLLFLLVPALVVDRDGRGLHDRLSDTAVVRGG